MKKLLFILMFALFCNLALAYDNTSLIYNSTSQRYEYPNLSVKFGAFVNGNDFNLGALAQKINKVEGDKIFFGLFYNMTNSVPNRNALTNLNYIYLNITTNWNFNEKTYSFDKLKSSNGIINFYDRFDFSDLIKEKLPVINYTINSNFNNITNESNHYVKIYLNNSYMVSTIQSKGYYELDTDPTISETFLITGLLAGYYNNTQFMNPVINIVHDADLELSFNNNTRDLSHQKRGFYVNGATYNTSGKIGENYYFDGDDAIDIMPLGSSYTEGTIAFWMNSGSVTNYKNIMSTDKTNQNKAIRFEQATDGSVSVYIGNDAGSYSGHAIGGAGQVSAGNWYHIAITWSQTNNNIVTYFNGNLVVNESHTYWMTTFPNPSLGVGFDATRYYIGRIDEVYFFKRRLTTSEIVTLNNTATHLQKTLITNNASFERVIDQWNGTNTYSTPNYWWNLTCNYVDKDEALILKLDDNSTTTWDVSGNNLSGTASSNIYTTTGCKYDGCYAFTGSQAVTIADNDLLDGMDALTLSYWFKTSSSGTMYTLSKQYSATTNKGGYESFLSSGDVYFYFGINDASYSIAYTASLDDNNWHNALLRYNGTTATMYIDGTERGTPVSVSGKIDASTQSFYLGQRNDANNKFTGSLDCVQLWRRALNSTELLSVNSSSTCSPAERVNSNATIQVMESNSLLYSSNNNSNLIGLWKLNENASTITDSSGNSYTGNVTGATFQNTSNCYPYYDGCYSFDGNDYISLIPHQNLTGTNNYTISAWIKTSSNAGMDILSYGNDGNHEIRAEFSTGKVNFVTYEGGYGNVVGNRVINDGLWHHVVYRKLGTTGTIYIDGLYDNSGTIKELATSPAISYVTIGLLKYSGGNLYYFNGSIDNVVVYNRALSTDEITDLYFHANFSGQTYSSTNYVCDNTPKPLPAINNTRFIKYKATLTSIDNVTSPNFINISFDYSNVSNTTPNTPPNISLSSPIDNYTTTDQIVDFHIDVDDEEQANVSVILFIDGIANQTEIVNTNHQGYHEPSSINTITGNNVQGGISNVITLDGITYNVTETSGSNPIDIRFNWTNITDINYIDADVEYSGSVPHNVYLQAYNYSSQSWIDLKQIISGAGIKNYNSTLNSTHFLNSTTNIVQGRILHTGSGNPTHILRIDRIRINGTHSHMDALFSVDFGATYCQNHTWYATVNDSTSVVQSETRRIYPHDDQTNPSNVTISLVTATATSLTWSWTNATDNESGLNHYNLYLDGVNILNTTNNSYIATGLTQNQNYTIGIEAVDNCSNVGVRINRSDTTILQYGLTYEQAQQLANAYNYTYEIISCLQNGNFSNLTRCMVGLNYDLLNLMQTNISQIMNQLTSDSNNITDILNRTRNMENFSTQTNITQILTQTTQIINLTQNISNQIGSISENLSAIRSKLSDNIFSYFSIPSGHLYINDTQVFSLYLTNNSQIQPITDFTIYIYNKSNDLEQSKDKSFFNNQNNEYWQTFTFTRAGEYRALANISYNGLNQIVSVPFTVQSLGQFDVNVVCPSQATFGEQITCNAFIFRKTGKSGDAYIKYYIEGQAFQTTTVYINLGENKTIPLSLPVNIHNSGRFVVQETNQQPPAEGSATFNILEVNQGSINVRSTGITKESFIKESYSKYNKQIIFFLFIFMLIIIIAVILKNEQN